MFKSRTPPADVARKLRQEAGFGCAVCGCPILEYHHIIEWQERQHFEPEHMVALCPKCHTEYGKLSQAKSYKAKRDPFNIRHGRIEGYLGGNKIQKAIRLGGMTALNCRVPIDYAGNPLFKYRNFEGEFLLDVFLPDQNFWPEVEISQNNLVASTQGFWDIEFKTNWIKFRRKKGDIFLEIDFRGDQVEVDGNFKIFDEEISLKEKGIQAGAVKIQDLYVENCGIGLGLGPSGKVLRPNYAMKCPSAIYLPPYRYWDPQTIRQNLSDQSSQQKTRA